MTTKYQTEQETLLLKIRELHDLQQQQQQMSVGSPTVKRHLIDSVATVDTNESVGKDSPLMIVRTMNETEASCILAASVKKRRVNVDANEEDNSLGNMMDIVSGSYGGSIATTPCAKPAGWVTERVATGLKQLSMSMSESLLEAASNVQQQQQQQPTNILLQSAMKKSVSDDIHRLKKMSDEIDRLRAELSCAMNQLHEQDKLIHQGI